MITQEPVGTFVIGKTQYAAGLFWQAAPSAGAAEKAARDLARDPAMDADLFCVRKSDQIQFGLGKTKNEHQAGMVAIAAALADAQTGNWLGVFQVDDGYIFCSVRKGAIMPDGDAFYTEEEEARSRLTSDLSFGNWDLIYAPATWAIADSEEGNIEEFIKSGKGARLRPVKVNPMPALIMSGVVMVGLAGGYFALTYEPPPPPPPPPVYVPPPPPPWTSRPLSQDFAELCDQMIEELPTYVAGFQLSAARCFDPAKPAQQSQAAASGADDRSPFTFSTDTPNGVAAVGVYELMFGTLRHLTDPAVERQLEGMQSQVRSSEQIAVGHYRALPDRDREEEIPFEETAARIQLFGRGQEVGMQVGMTEVANAGPAHTPSPVPPPPGEKPPIDFRTFEFEIPSPFSLTNTAEIVNDIPTVVLDEVVMSFREAGNPIVVRGTVYVQ